MNKTYENIRKTATGQRDDYTTGCLLDYSYFKDHYKMISIDLRPKSNSTNKFNRKFEEGRKYNNVLYY